MSQSWSLHFSTHWNVLGPFPQAAREQQFLSPSWPLDLNEPFDLTKPWPSSYADGGLVNWSTSTSDSETGDLQVTFPNIRWQNLLDFEGWAALQHHAVLRSTFTITPSPSSAPPTHVLVDVKYGSYFAIVPTLHSSDYTPQWHAGNIYDLPRVSPRFVQLPVSPSFSVPTSYEIWISGDYEIRLFGESVNPTQSLTIQVSLPVQYLESPLDNIPERSIAPDFVDGHAFGDAIGVALRNNDNRAWLDVTGLESSQELDLSLLTTTTLAPFQTRVVPIVISQQSLYTRNQIDFVLLTKSRKSGTTHRVLISINITQHGLTDTSDWSSVKWLRGTHFYAASMPSAFYAIPPTAGIRHSAPQPAILALHGAGVDILNHRFWVDALPRNENSWIVIPTGRTPWGLDWHGPSQISSLEAVEAVEVIVSRHEWGNVDSQQLVVLGHSNGGQGAWYLAARWPDKILGVVPAAGFLKSQQYVPWTLSRSAHYLDPALRAILDTSLTPDDNDLHLSNLVDTPVLAIHGGNDENVPTWHSREAVSVLKTWNPQANVSYREDSGQLHWYDTVLDNEEVRMFIDTSLKPSHKTWSSFTLTVSDPVNQGSLHGIHVVLLATPGRLGALTVDKTSEQAGTITTKNICKFTIDTSVTPFHATSIDGATVPLPSDSGLVTFIRDKTWQIAPTSDDSTSLFSTRIQSILTSPGPLRLVIDGDNPASLAAALRIATDLDVYHELDSEILHSSDTSHLVKVRGNIVLVGDSEYARKLLGQQKTGFTIMNDSLALQGQSLNQSGLGILFLHPDPSDKAGQVALFLQSTDPKGLERALRLFPIRTGITAPDWIVTGSKADLIGTAGVLGAGVWSNSWRWSDALAWLD